AGEWRSEASAQPASSRVFSTRASALRENGVNLQQFEQRVYDYQDRVYGYACYYLGDHEAARDVTQEVLIRLWQHGSDVDEERVVGWLLRVARNACIDALRKRRSARQFLAPAADDLDRAAAPDDSPIDDAEAHDFQRHLRRALDRLSDPYRSIVILREIQ